MCCILCAYVRVIYCSLIPDTFVNKEDIVSCMKIAGSCWNLATIKIITITLKNIFNGVTMHRKVQLATIYLERDDNLVFFTHSKVITIIIIKFLTSSDSKTKN